MASWQTMMPCLRAKATTLAKNSGVAVAAVGLFG